MKKHDKIVITGATGMVGRYFVSHLLKEGYTNIYAIVRKQSNLNGLSNVTPLYISLFDIASLTDAFRDTELLINCAAIVDLKNTNPQKLIDDNVRMAHCVSQAALAVNVGRMLHISSIATLTAQPYPTMTTESSVMTTLSGRSPYSVSKFYGEGEVWRAINQGLKAIIVNPAVIIGEGDWNSGTSQFFKIVNKCPFFYTNGVMGYVSATDVARFGFALSQQEETIGKRFILCSDNLSYQKLISYIRTSLGKKGIFTAIPDSVIRAVVKITGKRFLENLIDKDNYDGTAAEEAAGIKYTSIQEEIIKIGRQYKTK